jgi:catechol-2,3-dioxygenase
MEQRLSIITLGVDDLPAMQAFYKNKIGWQPVAANRDIVFFRLNGFLLSLFSLKQLADFINLPQVQSGFRGFTLAYNVNSGQEVLNIYQNLLNKEVKIVRKPFSPSFGGLLFYFADIEENIWEVAHNPYIPLDEQGNVITHHEIDHL